MYTLGINSAYHESSACLLRQGEMVAAVEEERLTRHKHAKPARVDNPHELPWAAIATCLKQARIDAGAIERIGFSFAPGVRPRSCRPDDVTVKDGWGTPAGEGIFDERLRSVPELLAAAGLRGQFRFIEHHRCHAASTFLCSPFDEAAVLTVDGIGEAASTQLAVGRGERIEVLRDIEYPASLGFLWERFSQFLGFGEYDACKVMGLAAYGDPARLRDKMRGLVRLSDDGSFTVDNAVLRFRAPHDGLLGEFLGVPARRPRSPILQEHEDVAAALQEITEDVIVHIAAHLQAQTGLRRLCLAGGVALNCVANTALLRRTRFEELFVPSAPHDAGTALGAALLLSVAEAPRRWVMEHAYLGPSFSNEEIAAELARRQLPAVRSRAIEDAAAERIASGQVVGWFQGNMEFGPRALGNRSLLADPRDPNVRDLLNLKVKHREPFRPFAPSVLAERAADWFELPTLRGPAELMLLAVPARAAVRDRIPAVVHEDGTCRVQVVRREINPRYHALLRAFQRRTDVPLLLNTSFNDDEPIVCTPADAVDTFLKTRIDALAIGDYLVDRPQR